MAEKVPRHNEPGRVVACQVFQQASSSNVPATNASHSEMSRLFLLYSQTAAAVSFFSSFSLVLLFYLLSLFFSFIPRHSLSANYGIIPLEIFNNQ